MLSAGVGCYRITSRIIAAYEAFRARWSGGAAGQLAASMGYAGVGPFDTGAAVAAAAQQEVAGASPFGMPETFPGPQVQVGPEESSSASWSPSFAAFQNFALGGGVGMGAAQAALPPGMPSLPTGSAMPQFAAQQVSSGPVYAPVAPASSSWLNSSAQIVLGLLMQHYSANDVWWASRFWAAVQPLVDSRQLDATILTLLQQNGYAGCGSSAQPRMPDFKSHLERFAVAGPALVGGGLSQAADSGGLAGHGPNRWTAQLPVDLRRSALETFRNIRSMGCLTIRDWISQNYSGARGSPVWTDLWTIATSLDFRIAEAAMQGDAALAAMLNSDDVVEPNFRRLSAYIYADRTGDESGASRILGQAIPGTKADIGPGWLIEEATLFSKSEHQRSERVTTSRKRHSGKGKDDSKCKGKGGKAPKE